MYKTNGFKDDWYRHWFGPEYLKVYNHRDQKDAAILMDIFIQYAHPKSDQTFLDLACGNGRHAHILAQKGLNVVGVDLSMPLLTLACHASISQNVPKFIQADMRWLPLKSKFNGVLSLFTSFGYFLKEEDNKKVLLEITRVLKPAGVYLLDYMNASFVKKHLVKKSVRRVDDIEIHEKRYLDKKRVYKEIILYQDRRRKDFFESVRLYSKEELIALLQQAGFKVEKIFGNYRAEPYHNSSE
ncbi:MAG TPA: methyltransferase domain-containing protein, partial [Calditrichaeota bacterium]|nr:methyltransferase domain-containing protein [Calditrichota bacterium]